MKLSEVPAKQSVFSSIRNVVEKPAGPVLRSEKVWINQANTIDGLTLLSYINDQMITAAFFDPQYRGIMEKMSYGNEGERQKKRAVLTQMDEGTIKTFLDEINRVLTPAGHLFLWIDKFHLCEGTTKWTQDTALSIVDLITWDKGKIGMGYRTRRKSEYLLVLQKLPLKAKGHWTRHDIPDVWCEKITSKKHPHQKPFMLQKHLIDAVSSKADFILDPCAGSYSVMYATRELERNFIGGDLEAVGVNYLL